MNMVELNVQPIDRSDNISIKAMTLQRYFSQVTQKSAGGGGDAWEEKT